MISVGKWEQDNFNYHLFFSNLLNSSIKDSFIVLNINKSATVAPNPAIILTSNISLGLVFINNPNPNGAAKPNPVSIPAIRYGGNPIDWGRLLL
jgi:hypothetical protein